MAQKTDLNVSPYYDDFTESKNFHRVLFKPSVAIQARELTQLQSILQNQIERFGNHIFKEGSLVLGARTNFDNQYFAVKVTDTNPNGSGTTATESFRADALDKFYQGETSGVVAKVINTTAKTSDDPLTLHIKYQATGNSGSTYYNEFIDGEEIHRVTQNSNGTWTDASDNNEFKVFSQTGVSDVGSVQGSAASISEGVIYTRGNFVKVAKQTVILEKYSSTPSYKIGLDVGETLISSTEDDSLLDNASGSTNENAPGSDRLKISLTLAKKSLTATDSTNFIELMRVEAGVVTKRVEITEYSRIQDTLARRTYDESGDYMLQPFTVSFREHKNDLNNNGVYKSTDTPVGDTSKFIAVISAGKAYVRGYEVDRQTNTFLTLDKAREVNSVSNASSPFRIGNYVKCKFMYGTPDIGDEGTIAPFSTVAIYDTAKGSSASDTASGTQIGTARVRAIEYDSTGVYQVYLFDMQMYTNLTVASGAINRGQKYKGVTSGATGISDTNGTVTSVNLINVTGTFQTGETLRPIEDSTGGVAIGSSNGDVRTYNARRARRLHQSGGSGVNFAADLVLEDNFTLTGTGYVDISADADLVNGVASKYSSEIELGDQLLFPNGSTGIVDVVTSDTSISVATDLTADTNGKIIRQRAKVYKGDQTVAISGLPHDGIKTITVDSEVVRRQQLVTVASNRITMSAGSGESFDAYSADNYVASNESTGAAIDLSTATFVGAGTTTAYFTGGNVPANGVVVKITSTITRGSTTAATKTITKSAAATVDDANPTIYGVGYQHQDITLGVPDVYKVRAVYEGGNSITYGASDTVTTNPMPPSFVYTADSGNSVAISDAGTLITGSVSNARGFLIENDSGNCHVYYGKGSPQFSNNEAVTTEAGASGVITKLTHGSQDITERYILDDGQRDGYYGLGKITRKAGTPVPVGKLLVIFDYFSHGSGNYFTSASYPIEYTEIKNYVADRVDVAATMEPDGSFELGDSIDYRPSVADLWGTAPSNDITSGTPVDISDISSYPFSYASSSFGTGAHTCDVPKIGSNITVDYDHYLGRKDRLYLTSKGQFEIVKGESSLNPIAGNTIQNAIEIGTIDIPPYTTNASEVSIKLLSHRRYTMKDLEKMGKRLQNLETAVSLSMLETTAEGMQILDDDGFDKYKSGFVVDSFRGHSIADVLHPDYGIAIDQATQLARPDHHTDFFDIGMNSDKSSNVTKSGNAEIGYVVTLPFSEEVFLSADKASRELNVNPYDIATFIGRLDLSPDRDLWHDREALPNISTSSEGNFDAIVAGLPNGVGTVWNEWQQTWAGEPDITSTSSTVFDPIVTQTQRGFGGRQNRGWDEAVGNLWNRGNRGNWRGERARDWDVPAAIAGTASSTTTTVSRSVTPTREGRSGIQTSVVEDIVNTTNDRVVSVNAIPFMRSIPVTISGSLLKPNTSLNVFFDGIDVTSHCSPTPVTTSQGKLSTVFTIPNTDTLRFPTGVRTLKVTNASTVNGTSQTSAIANFMANGSLTTTQSETISTRNGRIVQTNVSGQRPGELVTTDESIEFTPGTPRVIWEDPLAQSFLASSEEGAFISSVEVYLSTKDSGGLPITASIREMSNGYPTQQILPSAEADMYPSDITTSSDGSVATKFTFPHPIYVRPFREYCIVLMSNSNAYNVWVGQMGDFDVKTKEPIDKQPFAGVLFKSQNSSTWTTEQMQDMKFKINRAKFTELTGKLTMENIQHDMNKKLTTNPIEIIGTGSSAKFKVYQRSHGMYDTDSNVTIAGVTGNRTNSILSLETPSVSGTGGIGSYTDVQLFSSGTSANYAAGANTGATCNVSLSGTGTVSAITVNNPGSAFATTDTLLIKQNEVGGTGATTFATIGVGTVGDTLGGISIAQINKTHTNIASYDLDSYEISTTITGTEGGIENIRGGGISTKQSGPTATKNLYFDLIHTLIPNTQLPNTGILPSVITTSTNTPQGITQSYTRETVSQTIALNDNNTLNQSGIVASSINETNEMSNVRSFQIDMQMTSNNDWVSPVIDIGNGESQMGVLNPTLGVIGIMNRINDVDSASDIADNSTYVTSTEADGDSNNCIYFTKKIDIENPASELRVLFEGYKPTAPLGDTKIETYYKIQKQDDNTPFEEKGWTQFSTTNEPDADATRFRTYDYTASNLDEFVGFAVKIVMKSKDTGIVPAIKAFRGLALA